jgi:chemotaxis response regulator CheB
MVRRPTPGDHRGMAIVVLGASSGGLGAVAQFLASLERDAAPTFFIAAHSERRTKAFLVSLLSGATGFRVLDASETAPILPATAYVIPPGYHGWFEHKRLRLMPAPDDLAPSIDGLFTSAAENFPGEVTAVVLSGDGRDGAAGAHAVKMRGGRLLVQDPSEATAPSMPVAVLETTSVDFCGTVSDLARWASDPAAVELRLDASPR